MERILNYLDNKNVIHNDDGSITIVNKRNFLKDIKLHIEGLSLSKEIQIIVLESKTFGILLNDNKHVLYFNKEVGDFELLSFISVKKIFPKSYIGNFILKKVEHHELINGDIILTIPDFRITEPEDGMDELDVIEESEDDLSNYAVVIQTTCKRCVYVGEGHNDLMIGWYNEFYTYKLTEI